MHIIKIQMIYHDNIHQALVQNGRTENIIKRLKQKPMLYRVYKIYHKYMIRKQMGTKSKNLKFIDNLFHFIARIYTTLNYSCILFISLQDKKICIFILIYLVYFFIYFKRINKTFLGYMMREDVEKIVDLKLDYFYEKYLSKFALKNQVNKFDEVLMDDLVEEEKGAKYTNEQIRKYINMNLFLVSVKLRLKITTFEEKNKKKIYWASIMVSMLIILLTYLSALIQWFPLFTTNSDKDTILNIWKTISKILGADFKSDTKDGFCNSEDMLLYVFLFFISSIDVYVMKLIRGLQVKLTKQLQFLESQNELENENDDYSEEDNELRNLEKLKKLEGLGGLDYDEDEFEDLLNQSEISSIESEAEDGKIITKEDKRKNLNTLLMKNQEEDMDYDEAIRRSELLMNGANEEDMDREFGLANGYSGDEGEIGERPELDPYGGEDGDE